MMNRLLITLFAFLGFMPNKIVADTNSNQELIEIQSIIPQIEIDLVYATPSNFTGEVVYDFSECYLCRKAVEGLAKVQSELESMGLGLKVWDGYRPVAAQWKFWELMPDERYVSDPRKGGRHTRGTAVDLTIINQEGQELPMPSAFDDFSEKAHRDYMNATQEEMDNRQLLQSVMEKNGFVGMPTEWWHFDLEGWENYPTVETLPQ